MLLDFVCFRRKGGKKEGRKKRRIKECPNKKALLRLLPISDLVSRYPGEPLQHGSKVLKTAPTLEGRFPASLPLTSPSSEGAGLSLFRDPGGPAAAMLSPAPVLGATLFLST